MNHVRFFVSGLVLVLVGAFLAKPSFAQGNPGYGYGRNSLIASASPNVVGRRIHLVNWVVTSISGSTLNITKNGRTLSVNAATAKLRARFWGSLTLSDIQVNDHLNIWGTWADQNKTTVNALLIRDLSDQRRAATFFGKISTIGTNSFVMATINRGNQTVNYVSGPIVARNEKPLTFANLSVGDRVRARGLWDRTNTNILIDTTQRKNSQIKDFSIPVRSPLPVSSATP